MWGELVRSVRTGLRTGLVRSVLTGLWTRLVRSVLTGLRPGLTLAVWRGLVLAVQARLWSRLVLAVRSRLRRGLTWRSGLRPCRVRRFRTTGLLVPVRGRVNRSGPVLVLGTVAETVLAAHCRHHNPPDPPLAQL